MSEIEVFKRKRDDLGFDSVKRRCIEKLKIVMGKTLLSPRVWCVDCGSNMAISNHCVVCGLFG